MKIIHISHLYHPSEGGVQFWYKNVSERLVKDYGDTVTLVTTNSMYGPERKKLEIISPSEETINGVKVLRFPSFRFHINPFGFLFKVCKRLGITVPERWRQIAYGPWSPSMKQYLLSSSADVICAGSSNYLYMQLPLWRRCQFFYFGSIHLPADETKPFLTSIQKRSINASELYIANTVYEKKRLEAAGIQKGKIKVLGVGVDVEFLQTKPGKIDTFKQVNNIPPNALIIGYAGRIEKTKNILVLIHAFEKLAKDNANIYLLVAGSGKEYVPHLKQYCQTLDEDICSRVIWKDNFAMEEKAAIFNSIDILVLPSNNESFGIVFLEAWACKKPVIGVAIGAVKDVISNGVDGLLMKMNDADDLHDKLNQLVNDEDMRNRLGQNGYDKVIENYTWDIITARLRECYVVAANVSNNQKVKHKVNV